MRPRHSTRWQLLVLALIMIPLGTAHAAAIDKLFSLIERGRPCQPASMLFMTHVGGGAVLPVWRSGGLPPVVSPQYVLEVTTGMQCLGNRADLDQSGVAVFPEAGYSLTIAPVDGAPDGLTHLGKLGVGVGYGNPTWSVAYAVRGLAGARDGDLALGVRHGVVARVLTNLIEVDVSHQFLAVHGAYEHDLRAVGNLNVLLAAFLLGSVL